MIKYGYTIVYVSDVKTVLKFYENSFNLNCRFLHESGDYGELETGSTVLAFASYELGKSNLPNGYIAAGESKVPLGIEIALVTEEVENTHKSAISNGAVEIKGPEKKPWGQLVSYIRCPSGVLIELCTPINA
ncbi:Lactoylglutathione lyase (EC 4.4.1.5) [uncultured Gammaproteobacteria bacterium]|nr:Lactoylglutathione lyase (EC 4.4.1.5) [uncultured Gammaproteobacteria bacterium]